jgi:hypothetical protein
VCGRVRERGRRKQREARWIGPFLVPYSGGVLCACGCVCVKEEGAAKVSRNSDGTIPWEGHPMDDPSIHKGGFPRASAQHHPC